MPLAEPGGGGLPLVPSLFHPPLRPGQPRFLLPEAMLGIGQDPAGLSLAVEQAPFGFGGALDRARHVVGNMQFHAIAPRICSGGAAGSGTLRGGASTPIHGDSIRCRERGTMTRDLPDNPQQVLGAIDLGSNSIKLTVARRLPDGAVEEFAWDVETVRLGRGLDATGRLAEDRIEAAMAALRRFAEDARGFGATRIIGVATEAVRVAANGADFLTRVRQETGIEVETVAGEREAALTFAGLDPEVPRAGLLVVADIGGASTEVIIAADGAVQRSRSVPIGSGRYTDRFVASDPPSADELNAARASARDVFATEPAIQPLPSGDGVLLVLVGGTGEYVGVLAEAAGGLSATAIDHVLADLRSIPANALADRLGIAEARARVLPAGAAIAAAVADITRPAAMQTARSGIRRGLLLEAFGDALTSDRAPLGL